MNSNVQIVVASMDDGHNAKCPRCWRWHGCNENFGWRPEDIASKMSETKIKLEQDKSLTTETLGLKLDEARKDLEKEHLCDRCIEVMVSTYPNHPSIPYIQESLKQQREKFSTL